MCAGCGDQRVPITRTGNSTARCKSAAQHENKTRKRDRVQERKDRKRLKDHCESCGFVPVDRCQLTLNRVDRNGATLCRNCYALRKMFHRRALRASRIIPEGMKIRNYDPDRQTTKQNRWDLKDHCETCGFVAVHPCQLQLDHVNGDWTINRPDNRQTLCANCHALKSKFEKRAREAAQIKPQRAQNAKKDPMAPAARRRRGPGPSYPVESLDASVVDVSDSLADPQATVGGGRGGDQLERVQDRDDRAADG